MNDLIFAIIGIMIGILGIALSVSESRYQQRRRAALRGWQTRRYQEQTNVN